MMRWRLFLLILLARLLNSFSIRTFFQPDEFYQALEPAHKLVYGYGYVTWEWEEGLRSAIHPLLYALSYRLLNLVNEVVAYSSSTSQWASQVFIPHTVAPKALNAIIAALADYFTLCFSNNYWQDVSMTPLILSLLSSWNWNTLTRSFLNNLEMLLTVAGLSYWPWYLLRFRSYTIACLCGLFSCIIRPTNAIIWGFLAIHLLYRHRNHSMELSKILKFSIILLGLSLALASLADRVYYQKWTFPIYNFLEFNVVKNLLIFYGSNPWHFYLFQGIPLMLMGYTPALVLAILKFWRRSILVPLCMMVVMAFSLISHKEFRFLQPIYPILISLSAQYIDVYSRKSRKILSRVWMLTTLALHASTAYFFTRINERGEIRVIEELRNDETVKSIGFLTPCHSTPWHSMLHRPEIVNSSWFLTCEPPLHLAFGNAENVKEYRDELDQFFDDPVNFVRNLPHEWPSHIVVFEPMEKLVAAELPNYHECHRYFNSYFHWDPRRQGDLIVYCNA